MLKICEKCGKEYNTSRKKQKYCSSECRLSSQRKELESTCEVCGKKYHLKPYNQIRSKHKTCSRKCRGLLIQKLYRGDNNPNSKGRNYKADGSPVYNPNSVNYDDDIREDKLYKAVCCEVLGLTRIRAGKSVQIHHRDCDKLNNTPENLVLLNISDHRWLHKQFGNATLWAYYNKKVSKDEMVSWSDDRERAERLLDMCVLTQNAEDFGNIVDGVLCENQTC